MTPNSVFTVLCIIVIGRNKNSAKSKPYYVLLGLKFKKVYCYWSYQIHYFLGSKVVKTIIDLMEPKTVGIHIVQIVQLSCITLNNAQYLSPSIFVCSHVWIDDVVDIKYHVVFLYNICCLFSIFLVSPFFICWALRNMTTHFRGAEQEIHVNFCWIMYDYLSYHSSLTKNNPQLLDIFITRISLKLKLNSG